MIMRYARAFTCSDVHRVYAGRLLQEILYYGLYGKYIYITDYTCTTGRQRKAKAYLYLFGMYS